MTLFPLLDTIIQLNPADNSAGFFKNPIFKKWNFHILSQFLF